MLKNIINQMTVKISYMAKIDFCVFVFVNNNKTRKAYKAYLPENLEHDDVL